VVYGPRSNAVAPVKSDDCIKLYSSLNDIQGQWKEHFQKLLNQETADQSARQWLRRRPTREDICEPITTDELEKAMRTTRNGKAHGRDGIAAEALKYGGTRLKEKTFGAVKYLSGGNGPSPRLQRCPHRDYIQEKGRKK